MAMLSRRALAAGRMSARSMIAPRPHVPRATATQAGEITRVVRVAHILLPPEKEVEFEQLVNEIKGTGGAGFSELARQHSTCRSAARGGELGWLRPGTFYPEFEEAAMKAQVGSVTQCKTGRGHHIIKVLEDRFEAEVQQMDVYELGEMLQNPGLVEDVQLVDVREPFEYEIARIPGFKLFPLSTFQEWSGRVKEDLDPLKETVVLCHHGVRSMQMAQFLTSQGFCEVKNVTGGIDAYSKNVDGSIPVY